MALFRKYSMASAIALAIGLTACGGGGGGSVAFIPGPPAPPPPPPPPPIGAAATATVPNASLFPIATAAGPTMQSHPTTVFPLLQSVVSINSGGLVADTATMNAGATLTFGDIGDDSFGFAAPGLGIPHVALALSGYYSDCLCGSVGNKSVWLEITTDDLSWTTYGVWNAHDEGSQTKIRGAFVTGYETPAGSVPTSGTATYNGSVRGQVFYPDATSEHRIGIQSLYGDASLQANFASGSITGSLTNMTAGESPWNSVSLLGAISGGDFTGTTAATSAPGNLASLSGSATGTFAGMFFGPIAQELGAVWTLNDGAKTAIGSIGAKTGP